MKYAAKATILVLATAVWVMGLTILVALVINGFTATGPGCPGDPEWLGYCKEVNGK